MKLCKIGVNNANALKRADFWICTTLSFLFIAGLYCAAKNNVDPLNFLKKDNGSNDVEKD